MDASSGRSRLVALVETLPNWQVMLLYQRLGVTAEQLAQFCQRASIVELALFGSILRDDFRPESDIDVTHRRVRL